MTVILLSCYYLDFQTLFFTFTKLRHLADDNKNSSALVLYHGRLVSDFFGGTLQCFGHTQSKNEVAPSEVSIFFKLTEVKTFLPTKIES